MINGSNASEGNMPLNEANESQKLNPDNFKEYGKKSLAPLVDLVHRYKGDINPYVAALGKGLQGAVDALNQSQQGQDSSGAERTVAGWFSEINTWFSGAQERMSSKNPRELLDYLEVQARDKPGVMFSSSYMIGLIFGRLGRHLAHAKFKKNSSESSSFSDLSSSEESAFSGDDTNQIH